MGETIRMQSSHRSNLNISKPLSFDHEVIGEATDPLIHSEARMWLINSGQATLRLQGKTVEIGPGTVVSILPWQITQVLRVEKPLKYYLIVYHLDSLNRAMKSFYDAEMDEKGWLTNTEATPVLHLNVPDNARVKKLFELLREEVGMESTLEDDRPKRRQYANLMAMNYLLELSVVLERLRKRHEAPAQEAPDRTEILRYLYLHMNEKLTLKTLSGVFYLSESAISAYITRMTGLSFFDLLNEMRIGKTANYLLYTDFTLEELAEIMGYVDASHISKVFSARVGMRVGTYRKTYRRVEDICQIEDSRAAYQIVHEIYRDYPSPRTAKGTADAHQMTVQALNRLLLCQVEKNFDEFLHFVRITRACERLLKTDKKIYEIAFEVGYDNVKAFHRQFLRLMAMKPSEFRKTVHLESP
jgi:YesN/AraC family two-component response regulator